MRITPAKLRALGTSTVAGLSVTLLACGATQPVQLSCQAQFVDISDGSSANYNFLLDLDPAKMRSICSSESSRKTIGDQEADVVNLPFKLIRNLAGCSKNRLE